MIEYLSRLTYLLAEAGRNEDVVMEADRYGMTLVVSPIMPQPHPESRYRLPDDRRLVMTGYTVDNLTRALCHLRPPSNGLAPHELVAQDLVALGRVREALALCGRATSDVYAIVRFHRVLKLALGAGLIDADEELFLIRVLETWR